MNYKFSKNDSIDRAINEFASGRPITVSEKNMKWVFFPLENFKESDSKYFNKLSTNKSYICLTKKRIENFYEKSLNFEKCVTMPYKARYVKWLQSTQIKKNKNFKKPKINKKIFKNAPKLFNNIIQLAKNAKILPCLVCFLLNEKSQTKSVLNFQNIDFKNQNKSIVNSTKMVCKSQIPLLGAKKSEIIIFKSYVGGLEHIAIKIGSLKQKKPVNLRIQSACFTGEVFHSMKCDCNEQLHQSIQYLSNNGGGLLIHLEQEGRGIGLINKIKAYDLQKNGIDTYESNHKLGFLDDERDFNIAIKILNFFNIKNVNLITNNFDKINFLKKNKININKIIPTNPSINEFNIDYFKTRSKKTKYRIKIK
tara:strand:- start:477 stop:1571 length:1095 start_codon:yes stop_codon:yes gene_type:complete